MEPGFYHPAFAAPRGRKTSAIMQRTLPPPSRSIVGIAAVTMLP
jgi:hypothetical protein